MPVEDELEAAAAASDEGEALGHLLAAWRERPASALATLIERVSERVANGRPALEGKTLKARHQAFLELAKRRDPGDLPRLLAVIPTMRSAEAAEELDALGDWPADPRPTPFFLAMIKKPPYRGSSTAKVWRRVFDVLVANGDPRLLEALPALDLGDVFEQGAARDITQRKLQAGLAKLVARFPAGAPELEGRARALFDRLGGRTKAQGSSVDELFARVLESPDDDGARLVYADALQEAGDPRGELIVLQFQKLSRKLTPEEAKHEKKLLHDHFARYFGELAPVVEEERTIFEKGFPVRVCCNLKNETQRKLAVGHRLWATVKTVDVNYAESLPFDVLAHPAMKSLEAVVSFGRPGWLDLGAREEPLPWTRVGYTGPSLYKDKSSYGDPPNRENVEDREILMRLHDVLPKLRRLSLSGYLAGPEEYSEWLWDAPVLQQLERLDVSSGVRKLSAWVAEAERRGLPRLHTISSPYYWDLSGWDAQIAHGGGGPWSSLRAHGYPAGRNGHAADPDHLVEALAALPEDLLTEVHIVSFVRISRATASAIESAARRQKRLATFSLS